jgi:hypothetical protein
VQNEEMGARVIPDNKRRSAESHWTDAAGWYKMAIRPIIAGADAAQKRLPKHSSYPLGSGSVMGTLD